MTRMEKGVIRALMIMKADHDKTKIKEIDETLLKLRKEALELKKQMILEAKIKLEKEKKEKQKSKTEATKSKKAPSCVVNSKSKKSSSTVKSDEKLHQPLQQQSKQNDPKSLLHSDPLSNKSSNYSETQHPLLEPPNQVELQNSSLKCTQPEVLSNDTSKYSKGQHEPVQQQTTSVVQQYSSLPSELHGSNTDWLNNLQLNLPKNLKIQAVKQKLEPISFQNSNRNYLKSLLQSTSTEASPIESSNYSEGQHQILQPSSQVELQNLSNDTSNYSEVQHKHVQHRTEPVEQENSLVPSTTEVLSNGDNYNMVKYLPSPKKPYAKLQAGQEQSKSRRIQHSKLKDVNSQLQTTSSEALSSEFSNYSETQHLLLEELSSQVEIENLPLKSTQHEVLPNDTSNYSEGQHQLEQQHTNPVEQQYSPLPSTSKGALSSGSNYDSVQYLPIPKKRYVNVQTVQQPLNPGGIQYLPLSSTQREVLSNISNNHVEEAQHHLVQQYQPVILRVSSLPPTQQVIISNGTRNSAAKPYQPEQHKTIPVVRQIIPVVRQSIPEVQENIPLSTTPRPASSSIYNYNSVKYTNAVSTVGTFVSSSVQIQKKDYQPLQSKPEFHNSSTPREALSNESNDYTNEQNQMVQHQAKPEEEQYLSSQYNSKKKLPNAIWSPAAEISAAEEHNATI